MELPFSDGARVKEDLPESSLPDQAKLDLSAAGDGRLTAEQALQEIRHLLTQDLTFHTRVDAIRGVLRRSRPKSKTVQESVRGRRRKLAVKQSLFD